MDSEPSISTVHQAILALYRGSDVTGAKEKASIWLGEFQKSLFAWSISDKLLHEKYDLESCYFAAQTMRTKIQYYFHELPPTSYESLRDSLLSHLSACTSSTDTVITTQLCLALADLYLQVPTWTSFVGDLISRFGSDMERSFALLELLKVLVEEMSSKRLRIGANRRDALSQEFAQQLPLVHEYLKKICEHQSHNDAVLSRVLRCLGGWLTLPDLPTDQLVSSPLLTGIFEILSNTDTSPSLHDAATECLVQALVLIENLRIHAQLTQLLLHRIHELLPVFHLCVAREDNAKLENYCRIFSELAESVLPAIIDTPGQGFGSLVTLDLLLICLGHHDYTLAEMTFNVWYRLSEYLYQRESDELTLIFRPYIQRLLIALHRHCRIDADHDGVPSEHEDFDEFRRKVAEVIKDVVFIVGSTECFKQMYEYLRERGTAATWDETEASLYIMAAIARNIIPDEEEVVPNVIEAIVNLPPDAHVSIYYTAVRLLGELSEWLNANIQYLEKVMDILLKCLKHPKLATVTTQSLEALCTSCKDHMTARLDTLLDVVNSADELHVDSQVILGLLRATTAIVSTLPDEQLAIKVRDLCNRQSSPLATLLQNSSNGEHISTDPKEVKKSKNKNPVVWLDRLAAIFRQLKPANDNGTPHPCLGIVTELWPVLLETCERYQDSDRVVEHACRTIRFMIRSLGVQSLPLLTSLVTKMLEIYQKHPHSCFLYLGSILVDEYGQFEDFVPGLIQMLEAFVAPTFKVLEQPNALRNSPDVVDDLFRLCIRFIQKAPFAFFQCNSVRPLFQCALAAISLDHRDACQSVNKFFVEIIEFIIGARKDFSTLTQAMTTAVSNANQLLSEFGQMLVQNLLIASIFQLSSPLLRELAEVLFELSQLDAQVLSVWLETGLKSLPEQGTLKATPHQLQEFHHTVMSAQDLRQVTNALRDLATLYR